MYGPGDLGFMFHPNKVLGRSSRAFAMCHVCCTGTVLFGRFGSLADTWSEEEGIERVAGRGAFGSFLSIDARIF